MKKGFIIYFIYLLFPVFLASMFYDFVNNNLILANILFYFILLIVFYLISFKDIKGHFKDFKSNYKKYFKVIIKWVIIEFILMIISNYIIQLFVDTLPSNEINNRNMIMKSPISLVYLLLVAPLVEDYVFRYSFSNIKNYYIYVILTSFLFATLHLLSASEYIYLWYFIPYFIMSLGFANIYYKTKNYFASTCAHIIHNGICIIIILLF